MLPPERVERLHREARAWARERVLAMSPGDRMEEAFRLYLLARGRR